MTTDEKPDQQIGRRLRQFRQSLGDRQADFAARVGKERSTIAKYERGERRLTLSDMLDMAERLNYPLTLAPWHTEIVELHAFFQGWLDGTLPATDAVFARLADTIETEFTLITPSGEIITRTPLLSQLRAAHESRPNWRMWIENAQLLVENSDLTVATYQEWQQTGDATTVRISTAVFRNCSGTPNGLVWLHVHETWLPHP
jgi:hypothetical protein